MNRILVVCTTDSMIWNFLVPHIKNLESNGYYVECASSVTGDFYRNLEKLHNIKMNKIDFERSPYKYSNFNAYKELCKLIKSKKFDIIFCHEPVGGALGRLAGHKCGVKVVYMAHGFHFYKGAPKSRVLYYWVEKFLSRYTDTLITINQEDYQAAKKFHAHSVDKIHGIGVDTSKFSKNESEQGYLQEKFNLKNDSITLLSVGELSVRKNHRVVIKALAKIGDKNLKYFIAGEGELEQELKELVESLNLTDQVYLLGYRTDIRQLCNSADIFIMPSIHEGLSVALMEAMGCGKPIICSRIRGNVDLIEQDKGGYLCDTFDIAQYAETIRKLVRSSEKRNDFGEYNQKAVKKFDIVPVKEELMKILEND